MQAGVGEEVDKPPWLEEWGGGASVENPHVQRVHYCELLVHSLGSRLKVFGPVSHRLSNAIRT